MNQGASRDAWYRRTTWTPSDKAEFEEKLARARSSRPEYLRIQASTLARTEEVGNAEPAIELARRYLEENPTGLFRAGVYETIAIALVKLGEIEAVIEAYREAIDAEAARPNVRDSVYLRFAWFAVTRGLSDLYDEVVAAMEKHAQETDFIFPFNRYRYFGTLAIIAAELGELGEARELAQRALRAASIQRGPFRDHPDLGLVSGRRDDIRQRLELLAADPSSGRGASVGRGAGFMHGRTKDSRVAGHPVKQFERGREYVARRDARRRWREKQAEKIRRKEEPLLREITATGLAVDSVWDLVNSREPYPEAIPVLLRHLQNADYDPAIREGIARALTVRGYPEILPAMLKAFRRDPEPSSSGPKWAMGNGIEVLFDDRYVEEIAELAREPSHGEARQMLVYALAKSRIRLAEETLQELLSDSQMAEAAKEAIKRRDRRRRKRGSASNKK